MLDTINLVRKRSLSVGEREGDGSTLSYNNKRHFGSEVADARRAIMCSKSESMSEIRSISLSSWGGDSDARDSSPA